MFIITVKQVFTFINSIIILRFCNTISVAGHG